GQRPPRNTRSLQEGCPKRSYRPGPTALAEVPEIWRRSVMEEPLGLPPWIVEDMVPDLDPKPVDAHGHRGRRHPGFRCGRVRSGPVLEEKMRYLSLRWRGVAEIEQPRQPPVRAAVACVCRHRRGRGAVVRNLAQRELRVELRLFHPAALDL